jgi:hypothetical protein
MNVTETLLAITIAIAGWNLLETIGNGKKIAAITQKIKDLPCEHGRPCEDNE